MVAGLSIQDKYYVEHICGCRIVCPAYCAVDRKFPGNKIGGGKPGEEFENRVAVKVNGQW